MLNFHLRCAAMFLWAVALQAWSGTDTLAKTVRPMMVGVAKVDVTPSQPVVLAGYGGRTQPFDAIDEKLWARACVIGSEEPVAVLVLDSCGVPVAVRDQVAEKVAQLGIRKECLVISATHTHNAPALDGYAPIVWAGRRSPAEIQGSTQYTRFAIDQMVKVVAEALANREPMHLEWAKGRVTFGGNRRVVENSGWRGFGLQRDGPVDHSLPILAGRDASGTVRFIWANYACHCTTVGARNAVGGDWAGYANMEMEARFPDAIALMSIGCGADIGPQPTGSLTVAHQHGLTIAKEVESVLAGDTIALSVEPTVVSKKIQLPLLEPPGKGVWESRLRDEFGFQRQLAKVMLERIKVEGELKRTVDYPITVCTFGDDLAIVFLAGEVVVDYAVKLGSELDWRRLWITAWTNAMPGYIPSRRILAEGGYEADFSQVYYAQPARYAPEVERILLDAIAALVGSQFSNSGTAPPVEMHQPLKGFRWTPRHQKQAFMQLNKWLQAEQSGPRKEVVAQLRTHLHTAVPGYAKGTLVGGAKDEWNDFAGDMSERYFLRQQTADARMSWEASTERGNVDRVRVFCFSGGMGWESEPRTEGFVLQFENRVELEFDLSRELAWWKSDCGSLELFYLPTWKSKLDTGGFFVTVVRDHNTLASDQCSFTVRSKGADSKRWFAIDAQQDMPERLKSLRNALEINENR